MQKWEYKSFSRLRVWESVKDRAWGIPGAWNMNATEFLPQLGEEGWELVAVSPRSGYTGMVWAGGGGADLAGFTTEEQWIFKRPK